MAKKRAVVITFGRFQPPTIGHEKLINAVIAHAQKIGAEHRIYASQSFDGNRPRAAVKNPLHYTDKIKFMRKMFPGANIVMGNDDTNTFMRVLYQLQKEKYTTVHVVVGDDRVPEIRKTVKQYLGSDDPETGLNFEEFKVVSAGKRDPEAEGVEGMSASKLRAAAADNDFKLFKKGMPSGFSGARDLFDAIRKGLEKPMKPEKKTKKAKVNEELLNEVTPPDEKSERFVKKAKASFKDRYGDDWASYLYGVAWKQYNKRHGKPTKTRLGEPIEEETLQEGGIGASLEDWLYDLPKTVISDLKTKFGSILKKAHYGGMMMVNDPDREKIRQYLISKKVKPFLGDKSHAEGTSAILMSFWTFHGDLDEATINEGAVKASIEDWIESLPKNVVTELKKKFGKELKAYNEYGSSIRDQQTIKGIQAILVKNNVNPLFDGDKKHHQGASELLVSFHSFHGDLKESTELDEATIPRDAQVVDRNKEEKTVTLKWNDEDGWHEEEVPEDEVPGFYDRAGDPLKQRKTDRFGNIMKTPVKGAEKKTEKAMAANKKNAQEILDIIKKKPMKTPITVYGKKYGKNDEYELVIMRRLYMGDEVYVVKSSGRFVELNVGASGLQIVDAKTKKILLDKGNDATW